MLLCGLLMPFQSVPAQLFLCTALLRCINTPSCKQKIQKHLNYISIIYNYSGIKIDLRLQLASCLRTAVLQQRLLCFESAAIITVDCVLTTAVIVRHSFEGVGRRLEALHFFQGLRCLNVICVGCKLAALKLYGSGRHGLGESACGFMSHHHML